MVLLRSQVEACFASLAADSTAIAWSRRTTSWLGRLAIGSPRLPVPTWMVPVADGRRLRVYRYIRGTDLFDADWYVARYAQGPASQGDPLRHFIEQGAARGFLPSAQWLGLGKNQCLALAERLGKPGRFLWRYMRSQRNPAADVFLTRSLQPIGPFTPQAFAHAMAAAATVDTGLKIDLLVIDHAMGGGANRYRDRRLAEAMDLGQTVALLTYHHSNSRYVLELCVDRACVFGSGTSLAEVGMLLHELAPRSVLLNNLASFPDVPGTIALARQLYSGERISLELPLHDYLAVCPSFNLLDDRQEFCGVPGVERCRDCIARVELPFPTRDGPPNIDAWRSVWAGLLDRGCQIVAFSQSSCDLLERAYPMLDPRLVELRPHTVDYLPRRAVAFAFDAPLHIGVVGEISFAKGAQVVAQLAAALRRRESAVRLSVIGTLDKRYADGVAQTGRYQAADLPRLLAEAGVNVCLVPSIWPETFCYVAEEVMRLGYPLATFDLGAPAERLRTYRYGHLLDCRDADEILDELATFWQALRRKAGEYLPVAD